jgi:hypothetical protein
MLQAHAASSSFTTLAPYNRNGRVFYDYTGVSSMPDWRLSDPDVYIHLATAVQQVQSYCLEYMASPYAQAHQEPKVHRFEPHAQFLDHMDEAISLFSRGETEPAFKKVNIGFDMLKDLLRNLHPMALATCLLLLCKLSVENAPVSDRFLQYSQALAATLKPIPNRLVELFRAIEQSRELLEMPLRCLRAASDVLEVNATKHWKTLYVKERHCDALYYTQNYGEVAMRRAQLLELQEAVYGPCARNVLWTSLNVADDLLMQNRLNEAEERFTQIAWQADQHLENHRAKTRLPALEGLAKVAYKRASLCLTTRLHHAATPQYLISVSQLLQRALEYANEALDMAQTYFSNAPRRIKRILDLRECIQSALDSFS